MNVKLIASAAGVGCAGLAVGVFALVGGSSPAKAPAPIKPAAQIVATTPAPASSAAVVVVSKAAAPVKRVAPKRHVFVSSSVQVQNAPAPVRRVAAVTEPTADPTTPDVPAPKVSDPATQGPGGGPLPVMLPPQAPSSQPVAVPSMPKTSLPVPPPTD